MSEEAEAAVFQQTGARLRRARGKAGFATAAEAARRFGWNPTTYQAHGAGGRGLKPWIANKYALAFGVSDGWLMTGSRSEAAANAMQRPAAIAGTFVGMTVARSALTPEAIYQQLGQLLATAPDLYATQKTPETARWLGQAHALVEAIDPLEAMSIKALVGYLDIAALGPGKANEIMLTVHRALAKAELSAPAASTGAFIPAASPFEAYAAVSRVFSASLSNLLVVDPYLDEKILTEYAPAAPEGVTIRLLTDERSMKPSLAPAVSRWISQYGGIRPLEVRKSPPGSLHDRVIFVDGAETWSLTQSFKDLAVRSHASLLRVDVDTAQLKIAAYESLWTGAAPL